MRKKILEEDDALVLDELSSNHPHDRMLKNLDWLYHTLGTNNVARNVRKSNLSFLEAFYFRFLHNARNIFWHQQDAFLGFSHSSDETMRVQLRAVLLSN